MSNYDESPYQTVRIGRSVMPAVKSYADARNLTLGDALTQLAYAGLHTLSKDEPAPEPAKPKPLRKAPAEPSPGLYQIANEERVLTDLSTAVHLLTETVQRLGVASRPIPSEAIVQAANGTEGKGSGFRRKIGS